MRVIAAVILLGLQAAPLPPAYPRPGVEKLLENDRVIVWNITWLKQQYPLHRHPYDLVGVYYTDGDRTIISEEGNRRPVTTKTWDTAFQKSGVTHIEEGASDSPLRAVFVEMKEPSPRNAAVATDGSGEFPVRSLRQLYDNERVFAWELPAPPARAVHRHVRDTVVVSFTAQKPQVTWIPAGTAHDADGTAAADHVFAFELK